jgi:starvation-inducible DNA-binding protein
MAKENTNVAVADSLSHLLADNYVLYLKTQNYHWNVTGPNFASLHKLFEEQYQDLATANDDIAERIRTLGEKAPASFSAYAKMSVIKEENGTPGWQDMVGNLAKDQQTISARAYEALKLAEETGDEPTVDLMIVRIAQHEKNKWMLDSILS